MPTRISDQEVVEAKEDLKMPRILFIIYYNLIIYLV